MFRIAPAMCAVIGFATVAAADVLDFTIYENADGGDVTGLHMTVELADAGSAIDFTFRNLSTTGSVITTVYFEGATAVDGLLLNGSVAAESAGVDYENGATPANPAQLPDWLGDAWDGTEYAAGALSPRPQNGVNEVGNEWVTIRFDYGAGADYDTIANALMGDAAGFRIAMHIQSVGDSAFSVWAATVPAPGTLVVLGLGALAARRQR